MKRLQEGFSTVEVLVILLVVGLLGAGGWLVYVRQKNNTVTPSQSAESQSKASNNGWKDFGESKLNFTFKYPEDWEWLKSDDGRFIVKLSTQDIAFSEDEVYERVAKGAEIVLVCPETAYTSLEQFKKEDSIYMGNSTDKKTIMVNGVSAEQYVVAYEGPAKRITSFFIGKQKCDVAMEEAVYKKAEYAKIYDQLIQSIVF